MLLCEAGTVRLNRGLYDSPARRIIGVAENVLNKAISLVHRCCGGIKRVFNVIPAASFHDISFQLECSIANISWLLDDDPYQEGVRPPIAADEPVLCNIWELNAILHTASVEDRCNAVGSLLSLANESEGHRKLIVQEGDWIQPLLRLGAAQEGIPEVQENAIAIITLLGKENSRMIYSTFISVFKSYFYDQLIEDEGRCNPIDVLKHLTKEERWNLTLLRLVKEGTPKEQENAVKFITLFGKDNARIIDDTVAEQFHSILQQDSHRKVQAIVAWAVSELVEVHEPIDIQVFHNYRFIECLSQLAFETSQDNKNDGYLASMTTRALWHLAKRSWKSCRIIADSIEFACIASLDSAHEEARYNSTMALLEVTAEAERDSELRKSVFNPDSPFYTAMIYQLVRVVEGQDAHSSLLIPCIKAIGNLSTTFTAKQTKMIGSLVELLKFGFNFNSEVSRVLCVTLGKLANPDNYLHVDHSREILDAGGAKQLVKLVSKGDKIVQIPALILLCYVTINIPNREEIASANVLNVLEWAAKQTSWIRGVHEYDDKLLGEAKSKLDALK